MEGKETDDLLRCSLLPSDRVQFLVSDAAAQDVLDCSSVEPDEDGWRAMGFPQTSHEVKMLLGLPSYWGWC